MIEIIIKWGIPFILTGVIGYIMKELKDNRNSNKAMKQGMII